MTTSANVARLVLQGHDHTARWRSRLQEQSVPEDDACLSLYMHPVGEAAAMLTKILMFIILFNFLVPVL